MSIINQTLRELDARKDAAPAAPSSAQAPASPRHVVPALWGLAGALLVLAGVLLWLWPQPADMPAPLDPMPPAANVPVPETPPPVAVEPIPVAPPVALPDETPAPPDEALAPPVDPTPPALPPVPVAATVAPAPPAAALPPPEIRKQARQPTPEEDAETHYRKAISQVRAGRDAQARPLLEAALQAFPRHIAARQMLATLLSEAGQDREAEAVLNEGRAVAPEESWFALALARLQAVLMELAPGEPLMSRDNLASLQVDNVASGVLPGLAELGVVPSSLRAIAPTYLRPGNTDVLLTRRRLSGRL